MAERSASTQMVIGLSATCSAVGKPYVLPVPELAGAVGPLLGVPESAVPVGPLLGEVPEQPATTSTMQAAAADTPVNVRGALR
jgi:hypothetical protein